MEQVAVITGANSGVGFALAKRLLTEVAPDHLRFRLCLACRNLQKAQVARQELLKKHPSSKIDVIQVDTSSLESSICAAKEIMNRYDGGVRWLYCNAGIMPLGGVNWSVLFSLKKRSEWVDLFSCGSGINKFTDWTMDNGLQAVFATNVLGHYIMIKEMEDFLISQTIPCHIVWTSSNTARTVDIDPTDVQGRNGNMSYPCSKRLIDLVSVDMNQRLNVHGIYSDTVCPGMVISQITLAIMPYFLWFMLLPIIFLIRVFITHFITFSASNGTESLVWLSKQDPSSLDHTMKYFSRKPPFGKTYVLQEKIPFSKLGLRETMKSLEDIAIKFLNKN